MKTSIIIIDQFTQRRDRLAALFLSIGCRVLTSSKNTWEAWDGSLNDWVPFYDEEPEQVDLMLIHGGDRHLKDCIKANKRIWYSGGTGRDARAEAREEFIFMALDDSGDKMLSNQDAEELLSYATSKSPHIPKCLRSEHYNHKLEDVLELLHTLGSKNVIDDDAHLKKQISAVEAWADEKSGHYLRTRLLQGQNLDVQILRHIRDVLFKQVINA